MNLEKVIFGFFIILACTQFRLFIGDIDEPAAPSDGTWRGVAVNLIATVLKFGDRTHLSATPLPPRWWPHRNSSPPQCSGWCMSTANGCRWTAVGIHGGLALRRRLLANFISIILLIGETRVRAADTRPCAEDATHGDVLFLILRRMRRR